VVGAVWSGTKSDCGTSGIFDLQAGFGEVDSEEANESLKEAGDKI
jgi:hypothetical protein